MAKKVTHTVKLGTSRAGERSRVWLEGKRLLAAGFTHRACVERQWADGKLVLRIVDQARFDTLLREDRSSVAGGPARPIIDISTAKVAATFKGASVAVCYGSGRIVIEEAN